MNLTLPYASVADWLRLLNFALAASFDIWMSRSSMPIEVIQIVVSYNINLRITAYITRCNEKNRNQLKQLCRGIKNGREIRNGSKAVCTTRLAQRKFRNRSFEHLLQSSTTGKWWTLQTPHVGRVSFRIILPPNFSDCCWYERFPFSVIKCHVRKRKINFICDTTPSTISIQQADTIAPRCVDFTILFVLYCL